MNTDGNPRSTIKNLNFNHKTYFGVFYPIG